MSYPRKRQVSLAVNVQRLIESGEAFIISEALEPGLPNVAPARFMQIGRNGETYIMFQFPGMRDNRADFY